MCRSRAFNKFASKRPAALLKKRLRHRSFLVIFVKVFYIFLTEQHRATTFEPYLELVKTKFFEG